MFKLHSYQNDACTYAIDMLKERKQTLIVAGTGAGKTIMMAEIISRFTRGFIAEHGHKPHTLVLVHRTEIHDQNHKKFSMVAPSIPTSEITANRKSLHGLVHFGMVQTVNNLLDEFTRAFVQFDLIVIDEGHHAMCNTYKNIIEWNKTYNPKACLLGVTATPNRGDKLPMLELFDNFYQITSRMLFDMHYLVRPTFINLSPTFTNEKGKIETGYLNKNVNLEDSSGQKLIIKLCEEYLKNKQVGKTVIFTPSHKFCEAVYAVLVSMGKSPAYLSLNISDEDRASEIERFENGDAEELINVDICTEGYDFPPLRNIVEFDTNGTHSQWVQKVGRVVRTEQGKTSCTVIDFGGNVFLYPEGIEVSVNLEGAFKKPVGEKLTEEDLFGDNNFETEKEKYTSDYMLNHAETYSPYHLPKGFETVHDKNFGIVMCACTKNNDCIIVPEGENAHLFTGDKMNLEYKGFENFDTATRLAMKLIGSPNVDERPISRMQIKLLAPEFPTTTLTRSGADCCICWKVWREQVGEVVKHGS